MLRVIEFEIEAQPKPKSRPRFSRGAVYTDRRTHQYEKLIRLSFLKQLQKWETIPLDAPVGIQLFYFFEAPKSWSKAKRAKLHRIPLVKRPDIDNLDKATLDALNGVAYRDDSQIFFKQSIKVYGPVNKVVGRLIYFENEFKEDGFMDEADKWDEVQAVLEKHQQRTGTDLEALPKVVAFCIFCNKPITQLMQGDIKKAPRWCGAACRDAWEKANKR